MNLSFNTKAMIEPTNPEHFLALLKEANAELDNLHAHWDGIVSACEKNRQTA